MSGDFDRSLDDIIKSSNSGRQQNGRFSRGIRRNQTKPYRNTQQRFFPSSQNYVPPSAVSTESASHVTNKLSISNLDYGVTESDLQALFEEHGPIRALTLHYDRTGRSLGTADITYELRQDAYKAYKAYKEVPLDGRPMHIEFSQSRLPQQRLYVPPFGYGLILSSRAQSNKIRRGNYGRTFQTLREENNAPNIVRRERRQKKQLTLEELDAQLDDYVSNHSKNL